MFGVVVEYKMAILSIIYRSILESAPPDLDYSIDI